MRLRIAGAVGLGLPDSQTSAFRSSASVNLYAAPKKRLHKDFAAK
jgi:hypothetical protein